MTPTTKRGGWWPWCVHNTWLTISVSHTQPVTDKDTATFKFSGPSFQLDHMMTGQTHAVQQCANCGQLRDYSLAGIHNIRVEVSA